MIESSDGRFRLALEDGYPLILPLEPRDWPSRDQLDYHRERVLLRT
jgi:hypothetical protein